MIIEEKKRNYELPQELKEERIWVCTRIERIGKETINIAYDPTRGESLDINDSTNMLTFDQAMELAENAPTYDNASIGLVLKKESPYFSIEIPNAVSSDGELVEIARKTIDLLDGQFYGEINEKSLIILAKGKLKGNKRFKNIKVYYFDRNHIVPLVGTPIWKPKSPWIQATHLEEISHYHFIKNCQVDENSEELPDHYIKTNSGGLRLLPNVLVTTILKQKDWLMCNSQIYARGKGQGVFQKIETDDLETEIIQYMSPKYLTNKDIEETKKLLMKRIPKDNELTDPIRMKGKVNFQNGVYDIESNTFGPYTQDYKTAYKLNANYNPSAQCPRFFEYINSSLSDDDINTVQEMMGYLFTTEIKAEKAFILYGPGNTGKSVLIDLIEKIIGYDYVSNIPFQDLGSRFSTVRLAGKLLNSYSDLPQVPIKDTGTFKALVSGDRIHADEKFEKGFEFKNTARLLYATNKLPSNFVDPTSGFYRRLIIIPFRNVVSKKNIDRNLKESLYQEREGIIQWALIGLKRLIENNYNFTQSEDAKNLMLDYMKENNNVLWFVGEYCGFDLSYSESGKKLYDAYKKACLEARLQPVSQRDFYSQLVTHYANEGVAKYLGSQSRAVEFRGIKLVNHI